MVKNAACPMLHVERFLSFQYLNPLLTPSPVSDHGQMKHCLDRANADALPGSKSSAVFCMPGQSSWIQRCTAKTFTRTVFAKGKAIHFLPDDRREALQWTLTQQGESLSTASEPPLPSSRAIPKTQTKGAAELSTACLSKLLLLAWINKRFTVPKKEVAFPAHGFHGRGESCV